MLESFGARLRQHREEHGIALATIAEQSKIKGSLLEALERDDVSQWPSGIYRRAYIRAYAHAIGLDPDVVLREFLERYPDQAEVDAAAAITALAESARANASPPTRLRYLVGSAIGSLARLTRGPSVPESHATEKYAPTPAHVPQIDAAPLYPAAALHSFQPPVYESPVVDPLPLEISGTVPPGMDVGAVAEIPAAQIPVADVRVEEIASVEEGPRVVAAPVKEVAGAGPDFLSVAGVCTKFARVASTDELQRLLEESARILDASGLIVWVWDEPSGQLQAALAHGYSDKVLSQLPGVRRGADNPTASAFRTSELCAVNGADDVNGALVVPLVTPEGCAGVLALELRHGGEQVTSVRAGATIIGAMLAQLVGPARTADVQPKVEVDPTFENFAATIRREHARR
ncbi:MAG: helix-turn-helix domain-containing protein [Vicinamibacterales bacterium]